MYEHMIPIMLEASAALLALSFLAIPLKITSIVESDPLYLKGDYPKIVRKFCVEAICVLCFSTTMLFAMSMYVVFFTVARHAPLFRVASVCFLGLCAGFLTRRAIFFYFAIVGTRTQAPDSGADFTVGDQYALDRIESSKKSRAWRCGGLLSIVLALVALSLFAVTLVDCLPAESLVGWLSPLTKFLQNATVFLWMAFVTLGLISVYIDHAFDDRLILLNWKPFERAMKEYAGDVRNRFHTKIVTCNTEINRLLATFDTNKMSIKLLTAFPGLTNMEPEQHGLRSLLVQGLSVREGLYLLLLEADAVDVEDGEVYDKLSQNILRNLAGQLSPFRARLYKLDIIEEVLREIERWRATSSA